MSQQHPFHFGAFLLDNGTVDTSRYVLQVARNSLHPGVVSAFITEAIGVDATATDPKLAHGYVRGTRAHVWVIPTDKIALFNEYLTKFNVMSLVNHLKALRAKMGSSTKVKPVKPTHLKVVTDDDYADEDNDEESDGSIIDGDDDSDGDEASDAN